MMNIYAKMYLQNGHKLNQNWIEPIYKGNINDWRNRGRKQITRVMKHLQITYRSLMI